MFFGFFHMYLIMWLSSCIVCVYVLVNRVHFVYPASFAFPIALSWALPYDICALK